MRRALLPGFALLLLPAAAQAKVHLKSSPELGKAEGRCSPDEPGPALLVEATGLKDRKGQIKLEVYPPDDRDFLADDNVLLSHGKTFRRVEQDLPDSGPVVLCIRVPAPGTYAVALLHDRDSNHKFGWWSDGVGFPRYIRLGMHRPRAALALVTAGPGLTRLAIPLMYRHGFGVATLRAQSED